jgi:hypothetical protein
MESGSTEGEGLMNKPIRVFFSQLSRRFYATRAYTIDDKGLVAVRGEKFDVTDDIANLIVEHNVEFRERAAQPAGARKVRD